MENLPLGALFLSLLALVIISGFFSGSEIGMMSINRYRLRHLVKLKNTSAMRVQALLDRTDRLLGVILIGNTFANILASAVATIIGMRLAGDFGVLVATISLTLVILIFSEIAPKTLAALHPQQIAFIVSWPLKFLQYVFWPLVWFGNTVSSAVLAMFGIKTKGKQVTEHLSGDELRTVVRETSGLIPKAHRDMLVSILDLEKVTVEDIMVPRSEINGIDLEEPWDDIVEQLASAQHTRLPVYEGAIDHVIGIIHVREILNDLIDGDIDKQRIRELMAKPNFIIEGTHLHQQLLNFKLDKVRTGLVVDEYGELMGLVTMEDILEEIVGEFTTDFAAFSKDIQRQADGSVIVDGSATIRELNRAMNWQLPIEGPKTISGLIIEELEFIPQATTCLKINSHVVEILQVKDNMVKTAKIK